ncbi:MAG: hypothetical protein ACLP4W_06595 [Mycobacterium sp.]|uniref:hypothetical protein n=1 Tax=Mycobacterium sp. TaxID=1785 RepID=UPI003F95B0C1
MDRVDAEKRIAELERQLAEEKRKADLKRQYANAVGQPPQSFNAPAGVWPQPAIPGQPGVGRRAGRGRRLRRLAKGLASIAVVVLLLWGVGATAYDVYAYRVGTPTTATVDHCVRHGRGTSCTAVWSVGGNSSTGPIVGSHYDHAEGSPVDVRVHGGTAYTPDVKDDALYLIPVVGVPIAALVLIWVWRWRGPTAG